MPLSKTQEKAYDSIGSLFPVEKARKSFLQLFFISDNIERKDARMQVYLIEIYFNYEAYEQCFMNEVLTFVINKLFFNLSALIQTKIIIK